MYKQIFPEKLKILCVSLVIILLQIKGAFVSTSPLQRYFLFWRILGPWQQIKSHAKCTKAFFGGKKKNKSRHILRKKSHILPYLDSEFLVVAKTRQAFQKLLLHGLTSSQIWLIPLVGDHQSASLKNLKKKKTPAPQWSL
jgi:hypothetical protein